MKPLILLLLIVFMLSISIVFAVKPITQIAEGDNVLEVRIPQADHLKVGRDVHANIHVFNRSTGLPVSNITGVSCYFDLYNQTGDHLIEVLELESDGELEWEIDIAGSNFSATGSYSFIIWCNNSVNGGFVSAGFDVTSTGEDEVVDNMPLVVVGGLLAIIVLYFIVLIRMFSERTMTEHGLVRMLFYLIAFWAVLIPLNILTLFLEHYAGPEEVIANIEILYEVMIYLNYFITIYFVLWFLIQLLKKVMAPSTNKLRLSNQ